MATHELRVDYSVPLAEQPGSGHNRWHPDIPPVVRCEPGDLLVVDVVDVTPPDFGYTVQVPGFGFLRDVFPEPHMIRWDLAGGWATSADLPGVRIPAAPFLGTFGVAPSRELMGQITEREQNLLDRGGNVLPP